MKFNSILFAALSVGTAVASSNGVGSPKRPRGFNPRRSIAQRATKGHPGPLQRVTGPFENLASNTVAYSDNWSGAVIEGNGFTYARGTFVVPTPHTPPGGDSDTYYSSAAWVGIDGDEDVCNGGLIQAGVLMSIQGGVPSYQAWYEWWPDEFIEDVDLPVSAGDSIRVSIYAYTATSGMILIENLTKNTHFSNNFSNMVNQLCFKSAEWVVEDWSLDANDLVPFANFTTVTFTDCYSNEGGLQNAGVWDIEQDNTVYTSCGINTSANTVTCSYV